VLHDYDNSSQYITASGRIFSYANIFEDRSFQLMVSHSGFQPVHPTNRQDPETVLTASYCKLHRSSLLCPQQEPNAIIYRWIGSGIYGL